jgi:hypothetical protein
MIRRLLATTIPLVALALPAMAQSVPAANYTDMWWTPSESGWGVSVTQHAGTNQVFAVWYTYDPREFAASGTFKPIWIVMPGGNWSSPTTISGTVYVANGMPFNQSGSNPQNTAVGTFTFNFTSTGTAQFAYSISAPSGLAPSDPAYNLPAMSGTKSITRQSF